ncbi:hypothetical protein BDR03DRAFT_1016405 [Suillus americanus]|nr:hypothetical protein BDR03DRAFT_1016405 [Suillus americanus]
MSSVDTVISAAEKLCHRDCFDSDLLISKEETDLSSSDSEDSNSTESSLTSSEQSSDSDNEPERQTICTATPIETSRKAKCTKDATSMEPHDEIEDLIKQLNTMSLEDPQYGLLYYRVTKLDPRVMQIISPPPPRAGAGVSPDSKVG